MRTALDVEIEISLPAAHGNHREVATRTVDRHDETVDPAERARGLPDLPLGGWQALVLQNIQPAERRDPAACGLQNEAARAEALCVGQARPVVRPMAEKCTRRARIARHDAARRGGVAFARNGLEESLA